MFNVMFYWYINYKWPWLIARMFSLADINGMMKAFRCDGDDWNYDPRISQGYNMVIFWDVFFPWLHSQMSFSCLFSEGFLNVSFSGWWCWAIKMGALFQSGWMKPPRIDHGEKHRQSSGFAAFSSWMASIAHTSVIFGWLDGKSQHWYFRLS